MVIGYGFWQYCVGAIKIDIFRFLHKYELRQSSCGSCFARFYAIMMGFYALVKYFTCNALKWWRWW